MVLLETEQYTQKIQTMQQISTPADLQEGQQPLRMLIIMKIEIMEDGIIQ